jgi:hypothetical protein
MVQREIFRDAIAHEVAPPNATDAERLASLLENPALTPAQRERVAALATEFLRRRRGLDGRLLTADARAIAKLEQGAPDLSGFLGSTMVRLGPEARSTRADLYRAYRAYCSDAREAPTGPGPFGAALTARLGPPAVWGSTPVYRGAAPAATTVDDPAIDQDVAAALVVTPGGRVGAGEAYRAYVAVAGPRAVSAGLLRLYLAGRFRAVSVRGAPGWAGLALRAEPSGS